MSAATVGQLRVTATPLGGDGHAGDPPVVGIALPRHQAFGLESVEVAHERRSADRHVGRELALAESRGCGLERVPQHDPRDKARPVRGEDLVGPGAGVFRRDGDLAGK